MALPLQFLLETVLPNLIMGKGKKKHSKKDAVSADVMDVAAASLKKFRKVTKEIGKLSTGQKLVGGLALVAAGLTYLASQNSEGEEKASIRLPESAKGSEPAETTSAADAADEEDAPPPRKPSKSRKTK